MNIFEKVNNAVSLGKKTALVTITFSTGSTPSKVGGMMAVVENEGSFGTIGGGKVESEVINLTLKAFEENAESFEFDFDLSKKGELSMVCGGHIKGFVNILKPRLKLVLFGGGHVNQKIANTAKYLPFDVYVVDDRTELLSNFENITKYLSCPLEDAVSSINFDENTYVVIATRGHLHDLNALLSVLNKKTAYIGLLGSSAKVVEIKAMLKEKGIEERLFENIYAPVGLKISDGTPEEIAFSILGEILSVKNRRARD